MKDPRGKTGLLLINLGTPDDPGPDAVGRYLKEFLMDPFVLEMPAWLRWILVYVLIVPRRKFASSQLYRNIWTKEGSPLLTFSRELTAKMANALGDSFAVAYAMRYGAPSLSQGLSELQAAGVDEIRALPLYPQFALSSVETALHRLEKIHKKICPEIPLVFYPEFYDFQPYLDVLTTTVKEVLSKDSFEHLLFSFHGLPESHIHLTDNANHCRFNEECCADAKTKSPKCYRAQCLATADAVMRALGWPADKATICFQSRLGRTPWLTPFTDQVVKDLARQGVKRIAVACPAFTADCLETLEEITFRARTDFRAHGGDDVVLIPSLNDRDDWVACLQKYVLERQPVPIADRTRFSKLPASLQPEALL